MKRAGSAILVGLAALITACGHSPAAPSVTSLPNSTSLPPSPLGGSLSGFWRGSFLTDQPGIVPFVFRAMPTGPSYEGTLELADLSSVDLAGEPRGDGSVSFSGERASTFNSDGIRVEQLILRPDASTGLQGSINGQTGFFDDARPYLARPLTGTVLSASLIRSRDESLSGSYGGLIQVLSCNGTCIGWARVPLKLTLAMNAGSSVTGFVTGGPMYYSILVPVSGSVSGNSLMLVGELQLQGDPVGFVRIESFSVTIDSLGRARGRFIYIEDFRTTVYPRVQSRYEVELQNVVRDVF